MIIPGSCLTNYDTGLFMLTIPGVVLALLGWWNHLTIKHLDREHATAILRAKQYEEEKQRFEDVGAVFERWGGEPVNVIVRLPKELHVAFKQAATERNVPQQSVLLGAIVRTVERAGHSPKDV